jgi:hypothetical protein
MSRRSAPIYPAYAFNESRTWFNWVKLTAVDVHGLREEPGFQGDTTCFKKFHNISNIGSKICAGQNIYFHLNHPIRYVCLTGLILSIDDKFNKYTLLELDDGSGVVITVKITRLPSDPSSSIDRPSNTTVSNVDVITEQGRYDVLVDKAALDIGTVIKVKGTISMFRNVRQLELKRIWIVRSTAEEIAEWEEGAKFKREVLNQPWVLSKERLRDLQQAELGKRLKREETERMEQKKHRYEAAKAAKRAERRKEHDERKEAKRKQQENVINEGALI